MITRYLDLSDPLRTFGLVFSMLVVVVLSLTLHEYAHAFVAYKNGDYTPRADGRLTLNPIKHIDLIGFIMLMVAGFGYAKPVRINPLSFRNLRKGVFTTAIAGVTVNLALAFVAMPLMYLFYYLLLNRVTVGNVEILYFCFTFFELFVLINVSLILFNLLPIYPLDGFRIVEAFTRRRNKFVQFMLSYGFYILAALVLLGVVVDIMRSNGYPLPYWLDLLGCYLQYGRYILWPLDKLWSTVFGVPLLL